MTGNINWVLEVNIKDGELDNLKAVMADMVAATEVDEPGTTHYKWYISADEKVCHTHEHFVDSAATMAHLGNFGAKFAERFLGAVEPTRLMVYGNPSDEVRAALAGFGAVHMTQLSGFAR